MKTHNLQHSVCKSFQPTAIKAQPQNPMNNTFLKTIGRTLLVLVIGSLLARTDSRAADIYSASGGGSWDDTGTWTGGTIPVAPDSAFIANDATVTVNSGVDASANYVRVGISGSGNNGTLSIGGGNLTSTGGEIGYDTLGIVGMTSGNWTNSAAITIGYVSSASGILNLSGGHLTSNGNLNIGDYGTGTLTVSGGTLTTGAIARLGGDSSGVGTANMTGGTWTIASTPVIGSSGTGTLNLSGGTLTSNATTIYIGLYAGSVGVANLTGGTWTTQNIMLGNAAGSSGTLNIGGTASGGNTTSTLNVDDWISGGSGNATINFNNNGSYAMSARLSGGTLVVNQIGTGTTTLTNGNSDYAGGTVISAGTLLVTNVSGSATGSGAVTVQNGGTLGGTGIISGSVTVQSGGTLSPGTSPGLLTVGSLTLDSGSTSFFEINGTTRGTNYDAVDVTGAIAYGGTLLIDFGYAPLITDTFNLFDFGSYSGNFSAVSFVDPGYAGSFDASAGILSLTAIPEPTAWMLMALAGCGAAFFRRRSKCNAAN